jgi:hypothetical protein
MTEQNTATRRDTGRALTWACMILVPALAIVAFGSALSLTAGGATAPGGALVAETRDFAAHGDSVTSVAQQADAGTIDQFMDTWQNTVLLPPSPRR